MKFWISQTRFFILQMKQKPKEENTLAGDHTTAVLEIEQKRTWNRKGRKNKQMTRDQFYNVLFCLFLFAF